MNVPEPDKEPSGFLQAIVKLMQGDTHVIFRFAIAFALLLALLILAGAAIPDNLVPLIYIVFIASFGGYLWWEWQQSKERERQAALAREEQPLKPETPAPEPPAPTPPAPPAAELRRLYLSALFDNCRELYPTSWDARAKDATPLALHAVFTRLDVPARSPEQEIRQTARREAPDHLIAADREARRDPALKAISDFPKLVLLGKPGSGKSTLVNFVALCLAGDGLGKTDVNVTQLRQQGWTLPFLLPVRVILREYAAFGLTQGKSLVAYLTDSGIEAAYVPHLIASWKDEGGLLLLDGLDEVPDAHRHRQRLRQAILDFSHDFPRVRILVTGRPYAYDNPEWQLPGFERTELLDYDEEQIAQYIDSWYAASGQKDRDLGPQRAAQFAAQLKEDVAQNASLQDLAPRPLLLALMVSLHRRRGGGALPYGRVKLYDESVELLLDLWERPKKTYDAQGNPRQETSALAELGIERDALRRALSEVAFRAHQGQAGVTGAPDISEQTLAGILYAGVPPARKAEVSITRVIEYVKNRAGLLEDKGPDPRGNHIHAFPHRTFQEYLAACHLLGLDTFPHDLVQLVQQNWDLWREVALLAAASTNPALVWQMAHELCAWQTPPTPAQAVADVDWQGAFLAGQILVERELHQAASAQQQERLARTQGWLAALVQRGALPPRDRAAAGNTLAQLGDPRLDVVPQTVDDLAQMPFCFVPGGPFWLGSDEDSDEQPAGELDLPYDYWLARYPVTVAQFRLFVEATGYEPVDADSLRDAPNRPVRWLTWHEALAFCRWLDGLWRDKLPAGCRVTLPSEVEWEKAARGGLLIPAPGAAHVRAIAAADFLPAPGALALQPNPLPQRRYPWGNEFDANKANTDESSIGSTSAVGAFPGGETPYGCLEMSGNVFEWTRSHWQAYPYQLDGKREDLRAGNDVWRVLRGGVFGLNNSYARCSFRLRNIPRSWGDDSGVRLAVSPFTFDR